MFHSLENSWWSRVLIKEFSEDELVHLISKVGIKKLSLSQIIKEDIDSDKVIKIFLRMFNRSDINLSVQDRKKLLCSLLSLSSFDYATFKKWMENI